MSPADAVAPTDAAVSATAPPTDVSWFRVQLSRDGKRVLQVDNGPTNTRRHYRVVRVDDDTVEAEIDLRAVGDDHLFVMDVTR